MFIRGPSLGIRLIILAFLALLIIFADIRLNVLDPVRSVLTSLASPIYWIADTPSRFMHWGETTMVSRSTLIEENKKLREQQRLLAGKLIKFEALQSENKRLQSLLNSSTIISDRVLAAEIIGVSPNPLLHTVVINKGSIDGVVIGQPLIDASGLMGQVIEVGFTSARVMLISDSSHAVPVQVNRNGVRGIAEGTGLMTELNIPHIPVTTDIKKGDLLVTSALGGVFPSGYPVARVTSIEEDPGHLFLIVKAKPTAQLNQRRHVLLVFLGKEKKAATINDLDLSIEEITEIQTSKKPIEPKESQNKNDVKGKSHRKGLPGLQEE